MVDDEPNVLEAYQRQFRKRIHIQTALGGEAGLDMLTNEGPFAVVISDFHMPRMNGTQFLSRVRESAPETVRMMLTGQADLNTAMHAVNEGAIFRFLTKPCPPDTLGHALEAGLAQYRLVHAEKELLEQTLTGSLKALSDVLSLVNPEAFGRASRLKRYVTGLAAHMGLPDVWRLEIAASLSQIGCVILPDTILQKISKGEPLSSNERQAFQQHPCTGADVLTNIPRMKEIAESILYQQKHYDGSGTPHDSREGEAIPIGARLLKVALDFDEFRMQDYPRSQAFELLEKRTGWYDPAVLQALKIVFVPEQRFSLLNLSVSELQPHMVLAEGIVDIHGTLLIAKGQDISEWMIDRLKQLRNNHSMKEPIRVIVPLPSQETEEPPSTGAEQARKEQMEVLAGNP